MKTIKTTLTAMLLLFLIVSCSKEEHNPLLGNWKCLGFGEITNTGKVLFRKPKEDCERCYTITFTERGSCPGILVANKMAAKYTLKKGLLSIEVIMTTMLGVWPKEDDSFVDALESVKQSKFEVKNDTLKIYYSTNKYILFKFKNKLK